MCGVSMKFYTFLIALPYSKRECTLLCSGRKIVNVLHGEICKKCVARFVSGEEVYCSVLGGDL